jgi:hypothetical protein
MTSRAARFAAIATAVHTLANVADHWVQTDNQANGPADAPPGTAGKAAPGPAGWLACTAHVATYTATIGIGVLAANAGLGLRFRPSRVAAGLAIIAGTHWIIDRRWPLRRFAELTGHDRFVNLGLPRPGHGDNPTLGTGLYALDQAAHGAMNLLAAAVIASGSTRP